MIQPCLDLFAEPHVVKLELPEDILRRWWAKVDVRGPSECWLWTGAKTGRGYGAFWLRGNNMGAHTLSFQIHHRLLLPMESVCHTCDVPLCVNQAHLFAGTQADNMRDRDAKGRQAKGDAHYARLHPEKLARGDASGSRLHPERLPRGDAHYARLHPEALARGERNGLSKLTEADVISIRSRYAGGDTSWSSLAKEFSVSKKTVSNVLSRKIWKHVP